MRLRLRFLDSAKCSTCLSLSSQCLHTRSFLSLPPPALVTSFSKANSVLYGIQMCLDKPHRSRVRTSVAVLAEIPLRSPQKKNYFIIKKYIYRIKVSKNKIVLFSKKHHWLQHRVCRSTAPRRGWKTIKRKCKKTSLINLDTPRYVWYNIERYVCVTT